MLAYMLFPLYARSEKHCRTRIALLPAFHDFEMVGSYKAAPATIPYGPYGRRIVVEKDDEDLVVVVLPVSVP